MLAALLTGEGRHRDCRGVDDEKTIAESEKYQQLSRTTGMARSQRWLWCRRLPMMRQAQGS